MQTLRSAVVPLLLAFPLWPAAAQEKAAKPPRIHAVTLGPVRKVPYTPAETDKANKDEESTTLKVRALFVDTRQREWTMGEIHDVTDRSFTVRRALRINDRLPMDAGERWTWQPGPWLLVDRMTGRIAALHLPDFDPAVSDAVWFRDYAAYCGVAQTAKGGLYAVVAQLGARRAVVQKAIGSWPQQDHFIPVCKAAIWQRLPMRVSIQPNGGEAATYDIVGSAGLIEEGDSGDDGN